MNKSIRDWLIVINLVGFILGLIIAYGSQLATTNPLLWLFVPDCPGAGLLFALSLILLAINKKSNALFLLTIISGFKYAIWTFFAIFSYWSFYVSPQNFYDQIINLLAHVGLFFEQFLLIKETRINYRDLSIVLGFLFTQDIIDYALNTHPYMPDSAIIGMFRFTLILTIFSSALVYYLVRRRELKVAIT